jgi:hypothetical protein
MGRKIRFPTVLENILVLSFVVRENIEKSVSGRLSDQNTLPPPAFRHIT